MRYMMLIYTDGRRPRRHAARGSSKIQQDHAAVIERNSTSTACSWP